MWNSARGRLTLLIAAITIPSVVLVALLTLQSYRNERASVSRHTLATTRALSALLDQQLLEAEKILKGIATTTPLERDDLPGLHQRALSILRSIDASDRWITLSDRDGQHLLSTLIPPGNPLPRLENPEALAAMRERRTYISNVITGPDSERPAVFVGIPIIRDNEVKYLLSLAMRPSVFHQAVETVRLAGGSIVTIVDRNGTIAARSHNADRFVGTKISERFAAATAQHQELTLESVTLDQIPVLSAFYRSTQSGWSIVIAAPRAELYASARRLLWQGLAICALLVLMVIFIARSIGRALVHSIDGLVSDTEALGRGRMPADRSDDLAEMNFINQAMRRTAERLTEKKLENTRLTLALQTELENQKRAEENNRRLAAIVESSVDAIIGKNLDGIITSWNQGAETLFGYRADEIIGRPLTSLIPPDRLDNKRTIHNAITRHETITGWETVWQRKDGTPIDLSLTVSPVISQEGRAIGASAIARDITERKRLEARQQALYQLVATVNRAAALPAVYDAALEAISRCNQPDRAAILLCDERDEIRLTAIRELAPGLHSAIERLCPWDCKDGTAFAPVWIDDIAEVSTDAGVRQAVLEEGIRALAFIPLTFENRLLGVFVLCHDRPRTFTLNELRPVETIASQVAFAISRQRSAEALESLVNQRTASLRDVVAQMEEFSYSVSHDLRAPVRSMRGYAQAVLEDHGDKLDDNGRDLLGRILRNGERMDRLIQDLLTYSRVSRRNMPLEPVSVQKLVAEIIQQYPAIQPDRADIYIDEPLPDVLGHEPSLTQVLSNLLSNAAKFVPPGTRPRITITAELRGNVVRLWFEDNGIGIKPESQSRLFGMFERIHSDRPYEGTGIGLAIVRKAIERMNGTAGVISDGINGSRFWVELPLAPSPSDKPGAIDAVTQDANSG
jgi:PAS domain S-box-containing protein